MIPRIALAGLLVLATAVLWSTPNLPAGAAPVSFVNRLGCPTGDLVKVFDYTRVSPGTPVVAGAAVPLQSSEFAAGVTASFSQVSGGPSRTSWDFAMPGPFASTAAFGTTQIRPGQQYTLTVDMTSAYRVQFPLAGLDSGSRIQVAGSNDGAAVRPSAAARGTGPSAATATVAGNTVVVQGNNTSPPPPGENDSVKVVDVWFDQPVDQIRYTVSFNFDQEAGSAIYPPVACQDGEVSATLGEPERTSLDSGTPSTASYDVPLEVTTTVPRAGDLGILPTATTDLRARIEELGGTLDSVEPVDITGDGAAACARGPGGNIEPAAVLQSSQTCTVRSVAKVTVPQSAQNLTASATWSLTSGGTADRPLDTSSTTVTFPALVPDTFHAEQVGSSVVHWGYRTTLSVRYGTHEAGYVYVGDTFNFTAPEGSTFVDADVHWKKYVDGQVDSEGGFGDGCTLTSPTRITCQAGLGIGHGPGEFPPTDASGGSHVDITVAVRPDDAQTPGQALTPGRFSISDAGDPSRDRTVDLPLRIAPADQYSRQPSTPTIRAGETGTLRVRHRTLSSGRFTGGSRFALRAPDRSTFVDGSVDYQKRVDGVLEKTGTVPESACTLGPRKKRLECSADPLIRFGHGQRDDKAESQHASITYLVEIRAGRHAASTSQRRSAPLPLRWASDRATLRAAQRAVTRGGGEFRVAGSQGIVGDRVPLSFRVRPAGSNPPSDDPPADDPPTDDPPADDPPANDPPNDPSPGADPGPDQDPDGKKPDTTKPDPDKPDPDKPAPDKPDGQDDQHPPGAGDQPMAMNIQFNEATLDPGQVAAISMKIGPNSADHDVTVVLTGRANTGMIYRSVEADPRGRCEVLTREFTCTVLLHPGEDTRLSIRILADQLNAPSQVLQRFELSSSDPAQDNSATNTIRVAKKESEVEGLAAQITDQPGLFLVLLGLFMMALAAHEAQRRR